MSAFDTKYRYSMNVKLAHIGGPTAVSSLFPNVEDLVMSSKIFDDLQQAVTSANDLNTQIMFSLNAAVNEERYGIMSEINPKHSNKETLSKEWGDTEIAKIWIIDRILQQEKPGPIKAVGLAQVLEVQSQPTTLN